MGKRKDRKLRDLEVKVLRLERQQREDKQWIEQATKLIQKLSRENQEWARESLEGARWSFGVEQSERDLQEYNRAVHPILIHHDAEGGTEVGPHMIVDKEGTWWNNDGTPVWSDQVDDEGNLVVKLTPRKMTPHKMNTSQNDSPQNGLPRNGWHIVGGWLCKWGEDRKSETIVRDLTTEEFEEWVGLCKLEEKEEFVRRLGEKE
jgi:hypothetical protein